MSLHHYNYIIKENPPASRGDGSEESLGYHVRLKPSPTVSQEQLVREMHKLEPVLSRGVINPPADIPPKAADPEPSYNDEPGMEDIDFCLELLHSDVINVAYILELIADLNPEENDYPQKRQHILDTMIKDAVMRNKSKLIDDFIRKNVDEDKTGFQRAKADGSMDLESRLNDYIQTERNNAIHNLAMFEEIDEDALNKFVAEYDFLQREKPEIIKKAIKAKKGLKLMERSSMVKRIIERLRDIISTYNWD